MPGASGIGSGVGEGAAGGCAGERTVTAMGGALSAGSTLADHAVPVREAAYTRSWTGSTLMAKRMPAGRWGFPTEKYVSMSDSMVGWSEGSQTRNGYCSCPANLPHDRAAATGKTSCCSFSTRNRSHAAVTLLSLKNAPAGSPPEMYVELCGRHSCARHGRLGAASPSSSTSTFSPCWSMDRFSLASVSVTSERHPAEAAVASHRPGELLKHIATRRLRCGSGSAKKARSAGDAKMRATSSVELYCLRPTSGVSWESTKQPRGSVRLSTRVCVAHCSAGSQCGSSLVQIVVPFRSIWGHRPRSLYECVWNVTLAAKSGAIESWRAL
mmetsp:Transcript_22747/g.86179  ORF Transcript_22747/g.86179 Transcript_22747/m.86179 type:complete len:326 (-) Transcript_22747:96-1073(-)